MGEERYQIRDQKGILLGGGSVLGFMILEGSQIPQNFTVECV